MNICYMTTRFLRFLSPFFQGFFLLYCLSQQMQIAQNNKKKHISDQIMKIKKFSVTKLYFMYRDWFSLIANVKNFREFDIYVR